MGKTKDFMVELIEGMNQVSNFVFNYEIIQNQADSSCGAVMIRTQDRRLTMKRAEHNSDSQQQDSPEAGNQAELRPPRLKDKGATLRNSFYSLYQIHSMPKLQRLANKSYEKGKR
jgi:hypothetical protein